MVSAFLMMPLTPSKAQDFLVDPACESSTCISAETVDLAQHVAVEFEAWPTRLDLLLWEPEVPCALPQPTGASVHKQISRELEIFPDNFCTNQGCRPFGLAGGGFECR